MDSIMVRPNGSGQSIGNRRAGASPSAACFSASPISPTYSTGGWASSGDAHVSFPLAIVVTLGGGPGPIRALRARPARPAQAISGVLELRQVLERLLGRPRQHDPAAVVLQVQAL